MTNLNAANISKLIFYMEGLDAPRFTMRKYMHECGAPACALGWGAEVFGANTKMDYMEWLTFAENTFGRDSFQSLFSIFLKNTIKTPQQWALHARKVLKDAGLEVEPNVSEQKQGCASWDQCDWPHCDCERDTYPWTVTTNAAGQSPVDANNGCRDQGSAPEVAPVPAAPYDFQAFMERVIGEAHVFQEE